MNKIYQSLKKLQKEIDVDDEIIDNAYEKILEVRLRKHLKKLEKKYGEDLVGRAIRWACDNLSALEFEKISPEKLIILYMKENPQEVSSEEIARALGTDKVKKLLPNPFNEEVDLDRLDEDKNGELIEKPQKGKEKPKSPAMPSKERLEKMSSDEIWGLIEKAREAGVE